MKMNLLGKSLTDLKKLIDGKEVTVEEVNSFFTSRIEKYNPILNAYLTVPENAKLLSVAAKDNYCTVGVRTTASSKVLDNFIPPYNATVVDNLEQANIGILGKTNMDAWAHGSSTETSDYGPTKNPWDTTRIPGGSSGGSAVAVSAYLAPAAIGTDTGGSIRNPAAWSGIVGLKPSYGRVSRYGIVAMGSSLDCPGPMTSTVEDAAYLLQIMAGQDASDATTIQESVPDYVSEIKKMKKMKIGVPAEFFEGAQEDVKSRVEEAIEVLRKLGHEVKPVHLLSPKYAIAIYTIIQRAEVSSNLARYSGIRYGNDRSHFGEEAKRRIMLGTYTLSHGYYDAYYKRAQKARTLVIENFKEVFADVDVIVCPTTPNTALKLAEFEKYPFFGELMDMLNEPASVAGIPAVTIPVGLDRDNLPVGMQIIGRHTDEASILNLAYQFEKETNFFDVIKKGVERYG
jgi:aspartyl-tRNA(Asn)/glutamyl-tRNA(Gln) amidotransferase subunit A